MLKSNKEDKRLSSLSYSTTRCISIVCRRAVGVETVLTPPLHTRDYNYEIIKQQR